MVWLLYQGTVIKERIQEKLKNQQLIGFTNGKDEEDFEDDEEYYYEYDTEEEESSDEGK